MAAVVILIPLAVGALLVVVGAVRAWRRRSPASTAGSVEEAGVPTFNVVALGARGSGKTLLLASMYHQMQTASGRSYFVTAPFEQVVLLNQWGRGRRRSSCAHRSWPRRCPGCRPGGRTGG